MKKFVIYINLAFVLFLSSEKAFGQYQGPGVSGTLTTVKEVKKHAAPLDRSDALVRVEGFIIRQINQDTFEFKDSTGTVKVEIDRDKLPEKPFDENTLLILVGEVDYDLLEGTEIEVEQILFPDQP
ncbi:MAG: NirD/YgiW/YdeI family stress tolerance protein [Bacteroidales bacterium]|jgi:uncharacterized protein (TIGR00156 family)|nr:NirD/YgiW/YdeI family stress tolerance protein [Bacteroidales bacterium]